MKGETVNLQAMLDGNSEVDGVAHSAELLRFVDAVLVTPQDLESARIALRRVLTDTAFVDTCATVASFNAVVKVADGTGIPLEPQKSQKTAQLRADLKIDQLRDKGRFEDKP